MHLTKDGLNMKKKSIPLKNRIVHNINLNFIFITIITVILFHRDIENQRNEISEEFSISSHDEILLFILFS